MAAAEGNYSPLPQYAARVGEVKAPVWIEASDAIVLHERLLALFGGAAGLRDPGCWSWR